MAKLYGTMRSERRARDAKKGGDKKIEIELSKKGVPEYLLVYSEDGLRTTDLSHDPRTCENSLPCLDCEVVDGHRLEN